MKKVSVIFSAQVSYWFARKSFESIGFTIKEKLTEFIMPDAPKEYIKTIGDLEIELFVIDHTDDNRANDYFNEIATNVTKKKGNLAELYNSVFKMATGEYVCIIPSGVFLQPNWLIELVYHYCNIEKSGVIGVISDFNECDFLPLLSSDGEKQISVVSPKDNLIEGLVFFNRQHLYLVGAFDESVCLSGNEINQFSLRCIALGFYNYYVPTDVCVIISYNERLDTSQNEIGKTNMAGTLSEMRKRKNYYIAL